MFSEPGVLARAWKRVEGPAAPPRLATDSTGSVAISAKVVLSAIVSNSLSETFAAFSYPGGLPGGTNVTPMQKGIPTSIHNQCKATRR